MCPCICTLSTFVIRWLEQCPSYRPRWASQTSHSAPLFFCRFVPATPHSHVPTVAPAPPPPSPPPAPRSDSPPGQNPAVGAATPPGQRCVGVRQLRRVTHPLRRSSIMPPLRSTLNLHANQNHLNTPRSPDKTLWDRRHVMHMCLSFCRLKRLHIRLWLVPAADQLAVLSADSVAGF